MHSPQVVSGPSAAQEYSFASRFLTPSAGSEVSVHRILFAGGCHVLGYPVGEEHSFPAVALRSLAHHEPQAPSLLGYISLRSGPLLVDICRQQEPEFLVLQLGNYETMPVFRKILQKAFHLRRNHQHGSSITASNRFVQAEPEKLYQTTFRTRFLASRRVVSAHLLAAMGQRQRVFDPSAVAASLDSILSSLQPLSLRRVFLLSPFFCPEPVVRACRLQARPIFEAAARKHGCVYIDAFGMLESSGRGKGILANFADAIHLSRLGHERVGLMVGEKMRDALAQMKIAANQAEEYRQLPSLQRVPALHPVA